MRDDDIVDLLLKTTKHQVNITDQRDDEIIHKLKSTNEGITVTDTHITSKGVHPVKWDEFIWDLGTWG